MARPNICKQCGKEFTHTPLYNGIHSSGIFDNGGHTDGFCSKGCMNAYEADAKAAKAQAKAAKAQAKAAEKQEQEQKKREQLAKEHDNARKEAKEALETAKKNVKKWEGIVEKLESAIESDNLEDLKSAATEITSWSSVIIILLVLVDIGAAVWYYFFR